MLEVSRGLNPECEHVQGDMRTLRLGSAFDAVLVHDAIAYMLTEDDLRATITTAAEHLRSGGVAVLVPDTVRELFELSTKHGGHDGEDGRGLRYLQWVTDPDPDDSTYEVDLVVVLREPGKPLRIEHDLHVCGVFATATWHRFVDETGLQLVDPGVEDPYAGEHAVFVGRKRA
jgi:hypothetical protein